MMLKSIFFQHQLILIFFSIYNIVCLLYIELHNNKYYALLHQYKDGQETLSEYVKNNS